MVKKGILLLILLVQSMAFIVPANGKTDGEKDATEKAQDQVFKGRIYNKEYNIFIQMNLYKDDVKIPGQDILGTVYGYLKKNTDSRVWAIMDVNISKDGKKATLDMVNDYGSEDLTAELSVNPDGTFTLTQLEGSPLKVAGTKKWVKLPKEIVFTK